MDVPGWTAVVVNYNGAPWLEPCLRALERSALPPNDIIVVDNASTDDSLQELHAFPKVDVLAQQRNLGFAGGANAGLERVETDVALLLNPDVEVDPDAGARLVEAFAAQPRLGAAGLLLCFPDGRRIQHAGGIVERPLLTTRHYLYGEPLEAAPAEPLDVEYVTGGAMGLRVAAVRSTGGFDAGYWPVYYEDVDLCWRLRAAGWQVRLIPGARGTHEEGATLGRSAAYYRYLHRSRLRFALRHLPAEEWHASFLPAEVHRLRHELHALAGEEWAAQSGADALESLLREPDGQSWASTPLLAGPPPAVLAGRVDAAMRVHEANVPPGGRGLRAAIDAVLRRLDPFRREVEVALARQRELNAALLDALAAQDALNREQAAMTLLVALDVLGQLQLRMGERDGGPAA